MKRDETRFGVYRGIQEKLNERKDRGIGPTISYTLISNNRPQVAKNSGIGTLDTIALVSCHKAETVMDTKETKKTTEYLVIKLSSRVCDNGIKHPIGAEKLEKGSCNRIGIVLLRGV
jgi:hypothetical protein